MSTDPLSSPPKMEMWVAQPPPMFGMKVMLEEPTAKLQWSREGKLQQQWKLSETVGGVPRTVNFIWRDVPTEA